MNFDPTTFVSSFYINCTFSVFDNIPQRDFSEFHAFFYLLLYACNSKCNLSYTSIHYCLRLN